MRPTRPLRTRHDARVLIAAAVGLAHLGLLLLASSWLRPQRSLEMAPREVFTVTPLAPIDLSRGRPRPAAALARPAPKKKARPSSPAAWAPASSPGAPVAGEAPGAGPVGRDAPDAFAVREALRSSVGCDMAGLKLRSDERDRCNDHAAKWARKGPRIGPAADDPKRAAELAADEDYVRRFNAWKRTDSGIHNGSDWWDSRGALGALPPAKHPKTPPPDIPQ